MIEKWFNQTLSVKRQEQITDDEGNVLGTDEVKKDDIKGCIQQSSPEFAEAMEMDFRKTFVLYTGVDEDVKEGDKINDEYSVKGVQEFRHPRMNNDHIKAVLQK